MTAPSRDMTPEFRRLLARFGLKHREGKRRYEGRLAYLFLGDDRSIRLVAQSLGLKPKTVERWSADFGWVEDAKAWDLYLAELRLKANLDEAVRAQNKRKQIADRLLIVSDAALAEKFWKKEVTTDPATGEPLEDEKGDPVYTGRVILDRAALALLAPKDLKELMRLGLEASRLEHGEPSEIVGVVNAAVDWKPAGSVEEAMEALERLRKVRGE